MGTWYALLLLMATIASVRAAVSDSKETGSVHIKMPNSHPQQDETYLCTPMKLDKSKTSYIVGFKPNATSRTAHHMLLYGCASPGREEPVFNCGAMTAKYNVFVRIFDGFKFLCYVISRNADLNTALHPCGWGHREIVYAWAQNAPELDLPDGVAFRVGADSNVDWLVLQVHYATVKYIPEEGDISGVSVHYTYLPQPKSAGVIFLGTNGRIPSKSTTHMEVACTLWEDEVIHPFAFRVHTHSLGRVVSGWKVVNKNKWSLLGKEDPQLPQMFYPVADNHITLTKDETIAARCVA